jgi:hypothetical protein
VDGTGSGSCPIVFFDISGVESSGSDLKSVCYLVRRILGKQVVRVVRGWNWHRILTNGGLSY